MFSSYTVIQYLILIPCVLMSLSFHEYAHGYVSYKFGDPTAKNLGRLTLNPLKHIDPVGLLCMFVCHVGWAKPVPVNARYYRNPRLGMAMTALAGPVMNFLLGFIGILLMKILKLIPVETEFGSRALSVAISFFYIFAQMNVGLAVFNLIPIPPLDGSRFAFIFLPTKWYFGLMKYERIIMIVMLVLVGLGAFSGVISGVTAWILNLFYSIW